MNVIKAYYKLNMKMLFKDKLAFIWSIFLPSIFLILNKDTIKGILDMRYFWSYVIFSSYVFGVGLHSLIQKEEGTLKTYFSIKESRIEFFIANVLTQITFCFISIFLFNLFGTMLFKMNFLLMVIYSFILIILSIPVAFLFFNITLIKNIHVNSLNTFLTIITMIFLFIMNIDTIFNLINPLLYISNILVIDSFNEILLYVGISITCVISGLYSIKSYSVISNEKR